METIQVGALESRVRERDEPTYLYTDALVNNRAVNLPESVYAGDFVPGLVSAFEGFATGFVAATSSRDYRHPSLSPVFQPTGRRSNRLTFMAAWGAATEFPLPREHKLPEYFGLRHRGRFAIRAANYVTSNKHPGILRHTTLDAEGFVGYFYKNDNQSINARMILGKSYGKSNVVEYQGINPVNAATIAVHALQRLQNVGRPLRLHAGVKHWPHSGYIANEFHKDSEHDVLDTL